MILLSEAELSDQSTISLDISVLEVLEKSPSLTDHLQKTSVGGMILRVSLEVLLKVVDPCCEKCNLNFCCTRVLCVTYSRPTYQ